MSSSPPPSRTESAPARRPRALTRTNSRGRTLERRPEVEAEIERALARAPSTWVAMAKGAEGPRLSSEAIVHLIRHLAPRSDQRRVLGELILALDGRVVSIALRWARGFDETTTEEIALEVGKAIIEIVLGDHPERADFLEAAFREGVKGRAINAAEKRRHAAKPHEIAAAEARREHPKKWEAPEEAFGIDEANGTSPETQMLDAESEASRADALRKALERIKNPKHREAVILHHLRGWPITSQDPDAETLCKRFGVGERQIREWIATAFAQMRRGAGEMS